MEIFIGNEYEIAENYQKNFFSSPALTIVSMNDRSIQFILNNGKGYGAMPLNHFTYLLKRNALMEKMDKREFAENNASSQEQIS